ncbi:hypothetical protein SAMN04487949_0729 [Halogranum gelatinilyticum]|uniref:Uncharacterized protein n=1 Tax=Halogranum gelatinilyticum TaxID=660521 RepID=A0A1G9Q802_9EURY|nr:hypothetical protein [Halogranum gelatinilyticum]SDM07146.1 hypothetical protein SAMN04487949_0729 [Halogranum gelatinilyticum]
MALPSTSNLRLAGLLVALLLVASGFYPGAFWSPYSNDHYEFTVAPESSEMYEEYTEYYDPEVLQYEDLSPTAQEFIERAKAGEPEGNGWGRSYEPTVCHEFLLVCDEVPREELPEEFGYGFSLSEREALHVIEEDGERYLLETGTVESAFFGPVPIGFIVGWLTVIPLGLFVGIVTQRSERDRLRWGLVIGGLVVAVLGLLAPYLEMFLGVSAVTLGLVCLVAAWVSIVVYGCYSLAQWVSDWKARRARTS